MPVVTITENDKTTYYAVTDADESRVDGLVNEYKLSENNSREYVEHALRKEYLRRLTEHAYECAQLAHLVQNPPDDDDLLGNLKLQERLARKIAKDAIWLRSYDPFTGLTADAVARPDGEYGTCLRIDCRSGFKDDDDNIRHVSSLGDDESWGDTDSALWARDPWLRDHFAAMEQEKAAKEVERQDTPAAAKLFDQAIALMRRGGKLNDRARARKAKTIANKTVRRKRRTA